MCCVGLLLPEFLATAFDLLKTIREQSAALQRQGHHVEQQHIAATRSHAEQNATATHHQTGGRIGDSAGAGEGDFVADIHSAALGITKIRILPPAAVNR